MSSTLRLLPVRVLRGSVPALPRVRRSSVPGVVNCCDAGSSKASSGVIHRDCFLVGACLPCFRAVDSMSAAR